MINKDIVNEAINYIMTNIENDISLDDVADYCHISKFHFSRIFKEETGESVYAFIKRVKLEQSAFRLKIDKNRSITEISMDYGYSSSNYSSAFRQHHNMSPVQFRKNIFEKSANVSEFNMHGEVFLSFEECNANIEIMNMPEYRVLFERNFGDYNNLSFDWCSFTMKYKDLISEDTIFIERTFDDPSVTDVNKCMYDICLTIPNDIECENSYIIDSGKYLVYHFNDHVSKIYYCYQSIFYNWLPNSKYTIDKRYSYDIYRKINCDTMVMEIDFCIPVQYSKN